MNTYTFLTLTMYFYLLSLIMDIYSNYNNVLLTPNPNNLRVKEV